MVGIIVRSGASCKREFCQTMLLHTTELGNEHEKNNLGFQVLSPLIAGTSASGNNVSGALARYCSSLELDGRGGSALRVGVRN
jgi:hypothetical protein